MSVDPQASTEQTWRQALDSALLQRLWRPVERPGLVRPGPMRAILARHRSMAAGLPLADLLHRRAGPLPNMPAAAPPIVYAQPHPWPLAAGDPSSASPAQAAEPKASPRTVVTAALAQAQPPLIARQPPPSNPPMPAPVARGASSTMVVQRKADPSAAGRAVESGPLTMAAQPHALAALPLPPRGPALATEAAALSSHIRTARSTTWPEADESPAMAARVSDRPIVESPLPLAYAAPARPGGSLTSPVASGLPLAFPRRLLPAVGVAPDAALAGETARLVVRSVPDRPDTAIGAVSPWQEAASASAPAMLVVRERVDRQIAPGANLPAAQPRPPLPLVPAAQTVAGQRAADRLAPAAGPDPIQIRPASAPEMAARGVETKRSDQPTIDIDRIVDKVHRKFLQRLAIEGERRGVR